MENTKKLMEDQYDCSDTEIKYVGDKITYRLSDDKRDIIYSSQKLYIPTIQGQIDVDDDWIKRETAPPPSMVVLDGVIYKVGDKIKLTEKGIKFLNEERIGKKSIPFRKIKKVIEKDGTSTILKVVLLDGATMVVLGTKKACITLWTGYRIPDNINAQGKYEPKGWTKPATNQK